MNIVCYFTLIDLMSKRDTDPSGNHILSSHYLLTCSCIRDQASFMRLNKVKKAKCIVFNISIHCGVSLLINIYRSIILPVSVTSTA